MIELLLIAIGFIGMLLAIAAYGEDGTQQRVIAAFAAGAMSVLFAVVGFIELVEKAMGNCPG